MFRCAYRYSGARLTKSIAGLRVSDRSIQALWYVGAGRAELRPESAAAPGPAQVRVRALFGAISRGTERLVFEGRVPASQYERMRVPRKWRAHFRFRPSTATPRWDGWRRGRPNCGTGSCSRCIRTRASSRWRPIASCRSRIRFRRHGRCWPPIWRPRSMRCGTVRPAAADHIAVVGGGVVGLLVARLCARLPGTRVTVIDVVASRAEIAQALGAAFAAPGSGAAGLRCGVPCQRNRRGPCHRAADRGRGGHDRGAELVRGGRCGGAARRGVSQPPAAAAFRARSARSRPRTGRAGAAPGAWRRRSISWPIRRSTACWRRRCRSRTCRSDWRRFSGRKPTRAAR